MVKEEKSGERLDIVIQPELYQEFRAEVAKQFGWKKGSLSKAAEEAIRQWIESKRKKRK